jgi:hypothetical protein
MVSQMSVANSNRLAERPTRSAGSPVRELPRSLYYCQVEDPPAFLLARGYSQNVPHITDGLRINPNCDFLKCGQASNTGAISEKHFAIADAACGYATVWVRDRATHVTTPFLLSPRAQDLLNDLTGVCRASAITTGLIESLYSAGILIDDAYERTRQDLWDHTVSSSRAQFCERGFIPVSNLIHPFQIAALRRYYRHQLRSGRFLWGKNKEELRLVAHNEPVASYFHHQLTYAVSELASERLKPSYCYFSAYQEGAVLARHTDREQCDFSLSMCIDYSPEPELATPWPLMLDAGGCTVSVHQSLGDALFYRGIQLPHWRNKLPAGHSSTSIFFHYVREDFAGPLD